MRWWQNFRVWLLLASAFALIGWLHMTWGDAVRAFLAMTNGILVALVAVAFVIAERGQP